MVLPMRRVIINAGFATLSVAVGCIIGWAFSLGRSPVGGISDSTPEVRGSYHDYVDADRMKLMMESYSQTAYYANDGLIEAETRMSYKIIERWQQLCDQVEVTKVSYGPLPDLLDIYKLFVLLVRRSCINSGDQFKKLKKWLFNFR